MSVKDIAASVVLALLFVSLVAIYLVTSQNSLVTGLSILILAISLVVTIDGGWREVGVIGSVAALVSAIAVALIGRVLFNTPGVIIFTLLWLGLLFLLFRWISHNILRVPQNQEVLVLHTYSGARTTVKGPIAPPLFPFLERKLATIPMYELGARIGVEKINTPAGHNIDLINVHVNYQIVDSAKAMSGILNPGIVQRDVAKSMGLPLDDARNRVEFWEQIFAGQIKVDVENVVRDVVFNMFPRAADAYRGREKPEFQERIYDRLEKQIDNWGARLLGVDVDHFEVESIRFRTPEIEAAIREREATQEATRIRLVRQAEAEAEAERVKQLVQTLKEAGVDLSETIIEDIVISAVQASTEWGLDNEYQRLLPGDIPMPRTAGKKDDAGKK